MKTGHFVYSTTADFLAKYATTQLHYVWSVNLIHIRIIQVIVNVKGIITRILQAIHANFAIQQYHIALFA